MLKIKNFNRNLIDLVVIEVDYMNTDMMLLNLMLYGNKEKNLMNIIMYGKKV